MTLFPYQIPAWLNGVHHDGSEKYLSNLHPSIGEEVQVRLRLPAAAPVKRVFLRTFPDGEQAYQAMNQTSILPPVQWWEGNLTISEPAVHYRFVLECEDGVWWYSAAGANLYDPLDAGDFVVLAGYQAPDWIRDAVFYQIFPDRFANGDPANDPQPGEFSYHGYGPQTYEWGAPAPAEQPFPLVFYGGDLQGIRQHLDYLAELGVTSLYLNPIFTAYSNHKYDVIDYDHVDPHMGGDEALAELRDELDRRGMRYVLDIVPNHSGFWHPWFQTARGDAAAPEAGYYSFNAHPEDYTSWLGVWSLPKLNYQSAELRRRIYGSPDAVFRRWLLPPFRADGWRVDVANMLARQGTSQMGDLIAREIRQAVKETRPDAYLVGENFFDASAQLRGDQWDGVMNYAGFTLPVWHWLRGFSQGAWGMRGEITGSGAWPTSALEGAWRSRRAAIPWAIALQQFNLLGSHDTPRIRSIAGGNAALHRLAAVLLFTYPGVPCLYYGDEIGMTDDPFLASRGCMPWDPAGWDREMLAFTRQLIDLRRSSAALQRGGFQMVALEGDLLAFQRETADERILVIAQRSETSRPAGPLPVWAGGIPSGARFREMTSGAEAVIEDGNLELPEHPQGATVWIEQQSV